MTHWSDHYPGAPRRGFVGPLLRWTAAGAFVLGAHSAGVWIALHWKTAQAAAGDPPAAIMVDLAPLAVAPEAPLQNVAPGPEMVEAQPEPDPAPAPEPEIKLPELPQMENAEAVVAPPPEPPKEEKPPEKKREVERKKPVERHKPKAKQTTAPTPSPNQAERATAPALGASANSSYSQASWKSEVMARLNRNKRFPPGANGSGGTVRVAFSINRSGQVLSARLTGSSGDSALDQEAVALIHRSSPLPAPPPEMGGGSISLNVPVRFNR